MHRIWRIDHRHLGSSVATVRYRHWVIELGGDWSIKETKEGFVFCFTTEKFHFVLKVWFFPRHNFNSGNNYFMLLVINYKFGFSWK